MFLVPFIYKELTNHEVSLINKTKVLQKQLKSTSSKAVHCIGENVD